MYDSGDWTPGFWEDLTFHSIDIWCILCDVHTSYLDKNWKSFVTQNSNDIFKYKLIAFSQPSLPMLRPDWMFRLKTTPSVGPSRVQSPPPFACALRVVSSVKKKKGQGQHTNNLHFIKNGSCYRNPFHRSVQCERSFYERDPFFSEWKRLHSNDSTSDRSGLVSRSSTSRSPLSSS